jgi:histidine triad (HIT) family protein
MNQIPAYNGNDFYCDEVLSRHTSDHRLVERENILAFHHTRPSYPVHIVVIPKRHIDSLLTLDSSGHVLVGEMISVLQQMAKAVTDEHGCCRVITNVGHYQDSKHLHWHVISGKAGEPAKKFIKLKRTKMDNFPVDSDTFGAGQPAH